MAQKVYPGTHAVSYTMRGDNPAKANGTTSGWAAAPAASAPMGGSVLAQTMNTVASATGIEMAEAGTGLPFEFISRPLSAAFTISGQMTLNVWASENNMSANVGMRVIVERLDAELNTISTIADSSRGVEVAVTTRAVNNWTVTPTSTSMAKGDRLRIRILGAGVGTMAAGFTFDVSVNGSTGGADGDTWVQFTENLTFMDTDPTGTPLYLTDTASDIDPGGGATDSLEAWTTRGGSAVTAITDVVNGWTAPVQLTRTGVGGIELEWYSKPLTAFTLSGPIDMTIPAKEDLLSANASVRAEVAVCAGDGSGATVWSAAGMAAQPSPFWELGTTEDFRTFRLGGPDVSVTNGQRLRFRIYINDSSAAMSATSAPAVRVTYNGPTGGASGDAFARLTETVTEFTGGGTSKSGSESYALTEGGSVIAVTGGSADTIILTDASSGSVTFARTDTNAFADASATVQQVDKAAADSGAESEGTTQLTQQSDKAAVDSSAFTDASTPSATITPSESFAVSEAAANLVASLDRVDSAALGELAAQTVTEFKVGVESFGVAEAVTLAVAAALVDSGSFSEATASLSALLNKVDAWALSEAAALANALATADTLALSAETSAPAQQTDKAAVDSGAFSDASSTSAAVVLLESFTLAELATLAATLGRVDAWALSGETSAISTDTQISASDSGALSEATSAIAAALAAVDSWTLSDVRALQANLAVAEAFVVSDLRALTTDIARVDVAALGTETAALQITNFLAAADAAAVAELAALATALSRNDDAALIDAGVVEAQVLKTAFDSALLSAESADRSTGLPAPPITKPTLVAIELWAASVAITEWAAAVAITEHEASAAVDGTMGSVIVEPHTTSTAVTPHEANVEVAD